MTKSARNEANAKMLRRLLLSKGDLLDAHSFVAWLLDNPRSSKVERMLHDAVTTAFVVAYSRPFTQNAPGRQSREEKAYRDKVMPCLPDRLLRRAYSNCELKLHEHLLKRRNQDFAHSDAVGSAITVWKSKDQLSYVGRNGRAPLGPSELKGLSAMIHKLLGVVVQAREDLKVVHHVPIAPGKTGDVLRVDIATDSHFPN